MGMSFPASHVYEKNRRWPTPRSDQGGRLGGMPRALCPPKGFLQRRSRAQSRRHNRIGQTTESLRLTCSVSADTLRDFHFVVAGLSVLGKQSGNFSTLQLNRNELPPVTLMV
jgi:hypothetical protein